MIEAMPAIGMGMFFETDLKPVSNEAALGHSFPQYLGKDWI